MMTAIMAVRNKEMRLLRATELCEFPESKLKNKVSCKEQNIEKLVSIPICRNPVKRCKFQVLFFFWKRLGGRNFKHSLRSIAFFFNP
jgi:hypothetical protein